MGNTHDLIVRVIGDVSSGVRGLKEIREAVTQTGKATETASHEIKASADRNVQAYAAQREKLRVLASEYTAISRSALSSAKQQEAAALLATRANDRLAASEGRASREARERNAVVGGLTKTMLGYAGAYVGATGVLSLADQSISAFNEERLSAAQLHTEFGKGAGQIEKWASTTAKSIFVWQGASEKMTAGVGKMLETMGLAPKKVAPMSEALVTLASKVAFLKQQDPERVLNMFEAGLAGRGRALKTLGFWLDDTTLKARAMQMGLVSASRDQEKIAVLTDRLAVDQAKYAHAVAKYGEGATQAHTANEALISTHEKLAKAIDGVVPKLTTEQKAIAANSLLMQQGKTYVDAFARAHGSGAGQLAEFHAEVKQLEEGIGKGLMPALVDILTPVNKWLSSSKNQEKVTHAVTTAVHKLEDGVKAAIPIVRDFYHGADKVAHFLGGWKHALELLLALKVVSTINRWTGVMDGLIGASRGGGLLGATSASDGLLGRLSMLGKIGAVGISIPIYINIIESFTKTSAGGLAKNLLKFGLPQLIPAAEAIKGITNFFGGSHTGTIGDQENVRRPGQDRAWQTFDPTSSDPTSVQTDAASSGAMSARQVSQLLAEQRRRDTENDRRRRQAEQTNSQIPSPDLYVGGGGGGGRRARKAAAPKQDDARRKLIQWALSKLGDPYVWGASGPNSFDCSGLVLWAMAQEGVSLPHSTYAQVQMGKHVNLSNIQAGDVVFTNYGEGGKKGPGHEGLYIGGGKVEQAPHTGDHVRIVSLQDFIHGGSYEVRDFLGAGHGKGVGKANTLLNLKMQGLELEQAIMQTLGRIPDDVRVKLKNKFGTVIGSETIGEIRKKTELLLKTIETSTSPDQVRAAVKGLQELGRQAKGAVGQMVAAFKASESSLKTSATHLMDMLLQVFDAKTQQMIQHAQAKVKMLDGSSFTISADQTDPNGLTPAEKQLRDEQAARDESQRQQAIADAQTALAQASTDADRLAAQKQLDDAIYAEHVAMLQKRADAERAAADKAVQAEQQDLTVKRALERDSFEQAYQAILARVEAGTETAGKAQAEILKLLKKYGIDANEATKLLGDTFGNELTKSLNKVVTALAQITNELRRMQGLPPIKIKIQTSVEGPGGGSGSGGGPGGGGTGAGRPPPGDDPFAPTAPPPLPPPDQEGSTGTGAGQPPAGSGSGATGGGTDPPTAGGPPAGQAGTGGDSAATPGKLNDTDYAAELRKRGPKWKGFKRWDPGEADWTDHEIKLLQQRYGDRLHFEAAAPQALWALRNRSIPGALNPPPKSIADATWGQVWYDFPGSQYPDGWTPSDATYGFETAGGFAGGGLVPGNDRGRDSVIAAVRPGELILTPEQQARNARMLGHTGSNAGGFLSARLGVPGFAGGGSVTGFSGGGTVTMPPSGASAGGGGELHVHIHLGEATIIGSDRRRVAREILGEVQSELTRLGRREGPDYLGTRS